MRRLLGLENTSTTLRISKFYTSTIFVAIGMEIEFRIEISRLYKESQVHKTGNEYRSVL